MIIEQKYIDRFHTKYEKKESGCWEWTGGKDKGGYGYYRSPLDAKAHRFSARIHGLDMSQPVVRHICNNPACVCPDHLATGTFQDNSNDKVKLNRQPMGITHGRSKLTEQQIKEIRAKYVPWIYSTTALAKEYGVSHVLINSIVRKKSWRHM